MSGQSAPLWSVFGPGFERPCNPQPTDAAQAFAGGGTEPGRTGVNVVGVSEALASSALGGLLNLGASPSASPGPEMQRTRRSGAPWQPCGGSQCDGSCGGGCAVVSQHAARLARSRGRQGTEQLGMPAAPDGRMTGCVISVGDVPAGRYQTMRRMTGGINGEFAAAAYNGGKTVSGSLADER